MWGKAAGENFHTVLFIHFREILQKFEVCMAAVQTQQNSELAEVYELFSQG